MVHDEPGAPPSPPASPVTMSRREAREARSALPAATPIDHAASSSVHGRNGWLVASGVLVAGGIAVTVAGAAALGGLPGAVVGAPDAAGWGIASGGGAPSTVVVGDAGIPNRIPVSDSPSTPPGDAAPAPDQETGTATTAPSAPRTGRPGQPAGPAAPGSSPSTPGTPGTPTGPANPGTPTGPTNPGTPTGPTNPGTPTGPTDPGTPTGPTDPGTPTGPTTPAAPAPLAFAGISKNYTIGLLGITVLGSYTLGLTGQPGAGDGRASITLGRSLIDLGLGNPVIRVSYSDGTAGSAIEAARDSI